MPRKPISFELDFMIKDIFPRFTVKQFDDVSFNIKPKNQGLDYDTTGMTGKIFVGVNNDMFMQTTGITVSNNNINILLDRNMLQKQGRAYAEVELTDSNGTITSSSFIFDIDPKIGEGGQIPGEYEGFVEKYERLISEFKSQVNSTINNCNTNVNSAIKQCNTNVDNKLNTVDSLINVKISDFEKRFNRLTSSQQQDAEVIDARTDFKGEVFDSLKERIDYTDKLLRDSTVSTVETERDFTTVEATSNGYFEDVKLEGKTFVNLSTLRDKTLSNTNDSERRLDFNVSMFKANTDYTLIMNVGNVANGTRSLFVQWHFIDGSASKFNTINSNVSSLANSMVVFKFRQDILPSELKRVYLSLHINDSTSCTCEIKDCIVLEGDHTQNPPSYFEGLKSVGQSATTSEDGVDEIVVSSVNENLFNMESVLYEKGINSNNGEIANTPDWCVNQEYIRVSKGVTLYLNRGKSISSASNTKGFIYVYQYNKDKIMQGRLEVGTTATSFTPTVDGYIRIAAKYNKLINFGVYRKPNLATPHQADKKRLLFYNEETQAWEKPILREWDSIEKHSDGKYYYHQRSGEVVLNGSESWTIDNDATKETSLHFRLNGASYNLKPTNNNYSSVEVMCDKFTPRSADFVWCTNTQNPNGVYEGIATNTSCFMCVRVLKSKLSTQDLAGFKKWLQGNNVTVVYQLEQEKVYECTNIDLITYANETNYIVDCSAISPKTTLKVHNNISNVVSLLQKKVSLLESNMTSYIITQNRLMLTSRYNADTVGFKVDVASYNNSFEYDNDLYELILNNILVGKDNYDREYIENLIIFYWMDFVISDEMHSILFKIIEEQHNPKVIEDEEAPL